MHCDTPVNVGIDVAKDKFDLTWTGQSRVLTFDNTAADIERCIEQLRPLDPERVVLEATGGYETRLLRALFEADLPVVRVNPKRVRDYAKSEGVLAKTDRLDARVIVRFADSKDLPLRPVPDAQTLRLQAWIAREAQLTQMLAVEHTRREQADDPQVVQDIDQMIAHLKTQCDQLNERIDEMIQAHTKWRQKAELLQSFKGIGPKNARMLVGHMEELGKANRKEIAALVGVAPYHDDSGKRRGQRHISAGRARVRSLLYMAARTAARFNPVIRAMYQRLIDKGKPDKVAITACMRKIITILNAIVRQEKPWQPPEIA